MRKVHDRHIADAAVFLRPRAGRYDLARPGAGAACQQGEETPQLCLWAPFTGSVQIRGLPRFGPVALRARQGERPTVEDIEGIGIPNNLSRTRSVRSVTLRQSRQQIRLWCRNLRTLRR